MTLQAISIPGTETGHGDKEGHGDGDDSNTEIKTTATTERPTEYSTVKERDNKHIYMKRQVLSFI